MKSITKKYAAVFAASVMAFQTVSIAAEAKGWTEDENGKKYVLSTGEEASSGKYSIGGTVYEFSGEGYCLGEFSGWAKSGGAKRRYNNGKPYTGWLKTKNGEKKYCLDGYLVTDEVQVGNKSYSFDENGIMTGEAPLALSADVGGKIKAGTDTITIKLTKIAADYTQSFGAPVLLERWEKGQWVDCFADLGGNIPMTLELYTLRYKGETIEVTFRSLAQTGYKLTPGFYRIPINDVTDTSIPIANPVAILSEDGKTAIPISSVKSEKADTDEPTVEYASTYAMFEVVAK